MEKEPSNSNRRLTIEQKEKNRIILDWIIKAKDIYVNNILDCGMCNAFKMAAIRELELEKSLICILRDQDIGHESEILVYNPEWPSILIPEFNFEFLGGDKTTEAYRGVQNHRLTIREIYWWRKWDSEVRINAFDKMIGIYKAKS
jgi:hypothetical protein